jgi:NAD(P)-dependent dehydrogenase (short-subunit alcohol dehydrogenase family)
MNLRSMLSGLFRSPTASPRTHNASKGNRSTGSLNILVTGCSAGFGELFAKTLAGAGHRVFASMRGVGGRNSGAAEQLKGWAASQNHKLEIVELDVTDQSSVDSAIASIETKAGHLDVVINNAGAGGMGVVESFSIEQLQQMFDVNTFGPMRVVKAALPGMRRRRSGLIINVTSTAGRIVIPGGNPYLATKFAMEALTESLFQELALFGVDVVILEPGYYPTTSFDQKKTAPADAQVLAEYEKLFPPRTHSSEHKNPAPNLPNPQEVADTVLQLVQMSPGTRPLRTVVGSIASAGVEELNADYEKRKKMMLKSLGMSV